MKNSWLNMNLANWSRRKFKSDKTNGDCMARKDVSYVLIPNSKFSLAAKRHYKSCEVWSWDLKLNQNVQHIKEKDATINSADYNTTNKY